MAAESSAGAGSGDAGGSAELTGVPAGIPVCDTHFHMWDTTATANPNLGGVGAAIPTYGLDDYQGEMKGTNLVDAVHVEAIVGQAPGGHVLDPLAETRFVQSQFEGAALPHRVVAYAHLGRGDAEDMLRAQADFKQVRGIRMILSHHDTDSSLTWPQIERGDYLKKAVPEFTAGYALLQRYNLSFDLHINPHQIKDAAAFVKEYPGIKVVLNHLGCPLFGKGTAADEAMLRTWREGVTALSMVPHTNVKLSAISYIREGWHVEGSGANDLVKSLTREAVELWGPERCMFASNYPVDRVQCSGAVDPAGLVRHTYDWLAKTAGKGGTLSDASMVDIFHDTAARVYGFDLKGTTA